MHARESSSLLPPAYSSTALINARIRPAVLSASYGAAYSSNVHAETQLLSLGAEQPAMLSASCSFSIGPPGMSSLILKFLFFSRLTSALITLISAAYLAAFLASSEVVSTLNQDVVLPLMLVNIASLAVNFFVETCFTSSHNGRGYFAAMLTALFLANLLLGGSYLFSDARTFNGPKPGGPLILGMTAASSLPFLFEPCLVKSSASQAGVLPDEDAEAAPVRPPLYSEAIEGDSLQGLELPPAYFC